METPIVPTNSGLNDLVYEPAEDSFLLLDALEQDFPKSFTNSSDEIMFCLEIGCGSGLISAAVAKSSKLLKGRQPCVFAADVNPNACRLTEMTGKTNNVNGSSLHTLMLDGTRCKVNPFKTQFDVILCNPPYVPIMQGENVEDKKSGILQKSWDGGADGNDFIVPFLSNIAHLLKPNGILYLLLSTWNNPEMLAREVASPRGLRGVQLIKRAAGRERLSVWKFQKERDCSALKASH